MLGYQDAAAAGTGMVVSSGGLVLTNNHVVAGSTQISVTIASTGETYTAKVVGTDATHDVALLQLQGASGLDTITIDQDDTENAGDAVTAIGNAHGGGVLMAADGTITKLDSTVTTAAEGAAQGETLDGVIQIAAQVVSGDSGGALLDADGEVIGMTTAASSGTADITGFAIPIESALTLAQQMATRRRVGLGVDRLPRVPGYRHRTVDRQVAQIPVAADTGSRPQAIRESASAEYSKAPRPRARDSPPATPSLRSTARR